MTSVASQIFLLFYAVLYGALFTISDRWRPFASSHRSRTDLFRATLAAFFFGLLPIGYFLWALPRLLLIAGTRTVDLLVAAYAVAPLAGFYFLWLWLVLRYRPTFYSAEQISLEPVKSSIQWIGDSPVSVTGVIVLTLALVVGPIVAVVLWNPRPANPGEASMPSGSEADTALHLYSVTTDSLHTLWGLLSVVALAIVGYTWGTKEPLRPKAALVLGIGFIVFASVNHRAIASAQTVLLRAAEVLRQLPPDASSPYTRLIESIIGTPLLLVQGFHIAVSVAVLVALYLAPRAATPPAA